MTETTFTDDEGAVRFSGKIRMGGTAGMVATVQANGTLAPASGGGGSGGVQSVTAHVTSAELLALNSNPLQLVAAPGAGLAIVPLYSVGIVSPGLNPYTIAGNVYVQWPGSTFQGMTASSLGNALSAVTSIIAFDTLGPSFNAANLTVELPLILAADIGDPTGGDGTLVLTVLYAVTPTV